jgi:hypothetical protein
VNISDMESYEMRELGPEIKPYEFRGPFNYSLRCTLCRNEVEHSREQHDALRSVNL